MAFNSSYLYYGHSCGSILVYRFLGKAPVGKPLMLFYVTVALTLAPRGLVSSLCCCEVNTTGIQPELSPPLLHGRSQGSLLAGRLWPADPNRQL